MTERKLLLQTGTNIRLYRKQAGLTQAKLAETIGVSDIFISAIECGRQWPSPTTIVKLSKVFKIEPYELLRPFDKSPDDAIQAIEKYYSDVVTSMQTLKSMYKKDFINEIYKSSKKQDD